MATTAAEGLPRRRFTVAELEQMVAAGILDEDERIELIGGEIVPMSPKGDQHEKVVGFEPMRRVLRPMDDYPIAGRRRSSLAGSDSGEAWR
jgi:Putative restriction endonuclease